MDSNADGGMPGLQHSGATATYESWLGYVPSACRMEVRQDAGKAVQVYEAARFYWKWSVHKELRDSWRIGAGSELDEKIYV